MALQREYTPLDVSAGLLAQLGGPSLLRCGHNTLAENVALTVHDVQTSSERVMQLLFPVIDAQHKQLTLEFYTQFARNHSLSELQ